MGCTQATVKGQMQPNPETNSNGTTYVKGVLKKPPQTTKGKTETLSLKRNPSVFRKSVNFNEQVRVKPRTPTPRSLGYEKGIVNVKKPTTHTQHSSADEDSEVLSVSSDDESQDDGSQATASVVNVLVHRNKPKVLVHKTNEITTVTPIDVPVEKPSEFLSTSLPPIPGTRVENQNGTVPIQAGKKLRILRKHVDANGKKTLDTPIEPSSLVLDESSSSFTHGLSSRENKGPVVVTRQVDIERNSSPKTDANQSHGVYYAFSRRPKTKSN